MKKLKSLALTCILMAAATFSFAGTEAAAKKAENEIQALQKQLDKNSHFPKVVADEVKKSNANVLITMSATGEIKVVSITCNDLALKNEIIKQLDNLCLSALTGNKGQLIELNINFKQL